MKKELEDMSIEELLNQFFEAYKQGSRPKEAKISAEGFILLDPNDPDDREWYENDEDYKF